MDKKYLYAGVFGVLGFLFYKKYMQKPLIAPTGLQTTQDAGIYQNDLLNKGLVSA